MVLGGRTGGEWIETAVRAVVGAVAAVLPLLGIGIAVVLMRTEPKPDIRPRIVLGSLLVGLPAVGLWHIAAGAPTTSSGWPSAAGVVGYVVACPAHQRGHCLAVRPPVADGDVSSASCCSPDDRA